MKYLAKYNTASERNSDILRLGVPFFTKTAGESNIRWTNNHNNYISNGLVFQLDGINKGSTANAWTDLIGNLVFTSTGCTSTATGWSIPNSSSYNSLRNNSTLSFPQDSYTIEACYNSINTSGLIFIPKDANNIALGAVADKRFIWNTNVSKAEWQMPSGTTVGFHTISINATRGLIDLNMNLVSSGSNSWLQGSYNGIGARSNNTTYSFNGTLYSIRIYNRQLSYDEMKYNQSIDKYRFFS